MTVVKKIHNYKNKLLLCSDTWFKKKGFNKLYLSTCANNFSIDRRLNQLFFWLGDKVDKKEEWDLSFF